MLFCHEFQYWWIYAFSLLIMGVKKCASAIFYAFSMCAWKSQHNFRSMEAAIPMVKKSISDLVKSAPKIPTWVLTSFKDPDVELVRKTTDVEELKTDLDALNYGGDPKDDLKEQALKGNL